MKTIKIIDLLNKIANGEIELGTKFIWKHIDENIILIFMERYGAIGLYFEEGTHPSGDIRWVGLFERYNYQILNNEVEILDEEDEFEDIEEIEHQYIYGLTANEEKIDDRVSLFEDKINQLIKNQKKIIEKLKEE